MLKAVIFDMDGLLIDSEPLWQEAEFLALSKAGVPLTRDMCQETIGLRVNEVVAYWYAQYPWKNFIENDLEKKIMKNVIALIIAKGTPKEGVNSAIDFVKQKQVKIALASSSYYDIINAVIQKFDLNDVFEVICSAEDEEYGKPHPAIYLTTATKLGVLPQECLAIEDSLNGVLAAKAAKMKCIAIPDTSMKYNEKLIIADRELRSLSALNQEVWDEMSE